jgi:uncharacterized membrane protein
MYPLLWIGVAIGVGMVAGSRSMVGPAVASRTLSRQAPREDAGAAEQVLASPRTARVLTALAIGEQIVDKLSGVPPRTRALALAARAVAGAVTAAPIAMRHSLHLAPVTLVAAAGAVVGAFLFVRVRARIAAGTGLPDAIVGTAEDAAAIAAATQLLRKI